MNIIRVVEDRMYPYSQPAPIPRGQVDFSKIQFLFSEDWYGKNKIAQFEQGSNLHNQDIVDGFCTVPSELELGSCMLYVKGYNLDGSAQIATANGIVLTIVQGAREGGTPAVPPPPDLYAKLIAYVDSKKSAYELAVQYGYKGTEEEYGKTLAEIGEVSNYTLLLTMQDMGLINPIGDGGSTLYVEEDGVLYIL